MKNSLVIFICFFYLCSFSYIKAQETPPETPPETLSVETDYNCYEADKSELPCYFIPEPEKADEMKLLDASYTVELPVNYFSNSLIGGTKNGVSPYLDAIDFNANFLSLYSTGSSGYYYFSDVVGDLGTITKVELKIWEKRDVPPDQNYGQYFLTNASSYYLVGWDEGLDYFTENYDDVTNLSGLAEWTWTAVNNSKIYIAFYKFAGDASKLYVDQAKLVVTYTPSAGGGNGYPDTTELIQSTSTEAEFYLDKTISYGDVIMFVFLSLFTIGIICKSIGDFIFNRN